MGKLFKEGAKERKKKLWAGQYNLLKNNNDTFYKILVFFVILSPIDD
jgi:hypothetical protein